jgi:hypothetical protein
LSWWMTHIFLIWCWIWFAIILLRIFAPIFIKRLACGSPFWRFLCLVLWGIYYWLHRISWAVFLPFLFHLKY